MAAERSPLFKSFANWFKSVANLFSVEEEPRIEESRLLLIPLVDMACLPAGYTGLQPAYRQTFRKT